MAHYYVIDGSGDSWAWEKYSSNGAQVGDSGDDDYVSKANAKRAILAQDPDADIRERRKASPGAADPGGPVPKTDEASAEDLAKVRLANENLAVGGVAYLDNEGEPTPAGEKLLEKYTVQAEEAIIAGDNPESDIDRRTSPEAQKRAEEQQAERNEAGISADRTGVEREGSTTKTRSQRTTTGDVPDKGDDDKKAKDDKASSRR